MRLMIMQITKTQVKVYDLCKNYFDNDNDKPLLRVKPYYLGTCEYTTENEIRIDFESYVH